MKAAERHGLKFGAAGGIVQDGKIVAVLCLVQAGFSIIQYVILRPVSNTASPVVESYQTGAVLFDTKTAL